MPNPDGGSGGRVNPGLRKSIQNQLSANYFVTALSRKQKGLIFMPNKQNIFRLAAGEHGKINFLRSHSGKPAIYKRTW